MYTDLKADFTRIRKPTAAYIISLVLPTMAYIISLVLPRTGNIPNKLHESLKLLIFALVFIL